MLDLYYKYSQVRERLRGGALGKDMDRIAKYFSELGYKSSSVKIYLGYIAQFSRFAAKCRRRNSFEINRDVIARFLRTRSTPKARIAARRAVSHAVRCASERFPQPIQRKIVAPQERLLAAYKAYQLEVRGLQPATCEALVLNAHRMIEWCHEHLSDRSLSKLTGEHVLALVRDFSAQYTNTFTRCRIVAYVRSFLRYLQWAGLHQQDLARFVPRARSYRLAHLPARLSWADIRQAIDAIDVTGPIGMRDRAMLLLFATTGIRNGELRSLELSDIHWKAGEILIRRTKNYRDRLVPLLQESGEALAEYVLRGRPKSASTRVFLTHTSPIRPLAGSGTVSWIVHDRLERGGLVLSRGGAHLLRHSLATNLVGQARPINEVADLLGHSHIDSTAIYVKVALPQLAKVALPFPGGAR